MAAATCRRSSARASRPAGPVPDEPFRAGMTVVIQPNVVTRDHKAGVQTGEMVLITQRPASSGCTLVSERSGWCDCSVAILETLRRSSG